MYKSACEQPHLCESRRNVGVWKGRNHQRKARKMERGKVSLPPGYWFLNFASFVVKILDNRGKASEQNFPRTHTSNPARRLYTDNLFGLGFRSLEFERQKRKKSWYRKFKGSYHMVFCLRRKTAKTHILRRILHFLRFLFRSFLSLFTTSLGCIHCVCHEGGGGRWRGGWAEDFERESESFF